MTRPTLTFNSRKFLKCVGTRRTTHAYKDHQVVYWQGDVAGAIFHIQKGHVKLVVTSRRGKKAVVAILGRGDIFGEGCLVNRSLRTSTATAIHASILSSVKKRTLVHLIHQEPALAKLFISYLLLRKIRVEEDLVDQLFNSSEKRLARILLRLSRFGKKSRAETVYPRLNQEQLAQMVGTTRSRVSHFMNKFKKLGFVNYDGASAGLTVYRGLLSVILHD